MNQDIDVDLDLVEKLLRENGWVTPPATYDQAELRVAEKLFGSKEEASRLVSLPSGARFRPKPHIYACRYEWIALDESDPDIWEVVILDRAKPIRRMSGIPWARLEPILVELRRRNIRTLQVGTDPGVGLKPALPSRREQMLAKIARFAS